MINKNIINNLKQFLLIGIGISTGILNVSGIGNPVMLAMMAIISAFLYIRGENCDDYIENQISM